MKLALLADIHANLEALNRVIDHVESRSPDRVIVLGDIINRGPQPRPCLEITLERMQRDGWLVLKGNHEDFVLNERQPHPGRPQWMTEVFQHSTWTCRQVHELLTDVETLPDRIDLEGPDGQSLCFYHASIGSNRDGLYESMGDEELRPLIDNDSHFAAVGHTHRPFVRWMDRRIIVNVGAVGLPFDRDPRAAYAWAEWTGRRWDVDIIRLPYDRTRTQEAMRRTGYLADGGPMVDLVKHELEHARPNIRQWHLDFEDAVSTGKMSVVESIAAFLADRDREARERVAKHVNS